MLMETISERSNVYTSYILFSVMAIQKISEHCAYVKLNATLMAMRQKKLLLRPYLFI